MKPDARPKYRRARPLPYVFQKAIEAKYNRLESEGILENVKFCEWATPWYMSPIACYCGDYAVWVPQYPFPLPEGVFLKLHGGQSFTKRGLKNTYQELPLDPNGQ